MNSEKYIGLDVRQATISVAVLDDTGKLVMECILENLSSHVGPSAARPAFSHRDKSNVLGSAKNLFSGASEIGDPLGTLGTDRWS